MAYYLPHLLILDLLERSKLNEYHKASLVLCNNTYYIGHICRRCRAIISTPFDITIKGAYLTQVGKAAFNQQQLSLGLAMLVIGGVLWFLFWRSVQSHVNDNKKKSVQQYGSPFSI